jgi:DNA-binding PadR family transcriptional regulator
MGRGGCHERSRSYGERRGMMGERGAFPPETTISGPGFLGGSGGGGGRGSRRERVLESGDLKWLALHLLAQQPSHGYELIRSVGELVGGDYSPSPGSVYPTLNLLEDLGHISASGQEGGRKQYRLTAEGQAQLAEQADTIAKLLARLGQLKTTSQSRRIPDIQRAMENLKTALQLRLGASATEAAPDAALVQRVADIIDRAAAEIGRA